MDDEDLDRMFDPDIMVVDDPPSVIVLLVKDHTRVYLKTDDGRYAMIASIDEPGNLVELIFKNKNPISSSIKEVKDLQ